jgi:hypothetical protein
MTSSITLQQMKLRDAQQTQREAMQQYPDVIQDPTEWIRPSTVVVEIPQLKFVPEWISMSSGSNNVPSHPPK